MDEGLRRLQPPRGLYLMTGAERPPGSVALSEDQVLRTQWHVISNWQPQHQMWPFQVGPWLLGAASAVSGLASLNAVRRVLRLRQVARISVLVAAVPVPAALTVILNTTLVTEAVLLQTSPCPVCLATRAAAVQLATGFVQPVGLAVLASAFVAGHAGTYRMPSWSDPLAMLHQLRRIVRPMSGTLAALVSLNLFVAFQVVNYQMKKMPEILDRLKSSDVLRTSIETTQPQEAGLE